MRGIGRSALGRTDRRTSHEALLAQHLAFDPPSALLIRLDQETEVLWTPSRRRRHGRVAHGWVRQAGGHIVELLECTGRLAGSLGLAGAVGLLSAHMVQLATR